MSKTMVVAAFVSLLAAVPARAGQQVTVVNTPDAPVPVTGSVTVANTPAVTVSGTPSVNVANTPAVTVSGTPSVNVANTPAVTVSGTPSVNVANTPSVNVASMPSVSVSSLPSVAVSSMPAVALAGTSSVRDADNDVRNAFVAEIDLDINNVSGEYIQTPPGTRLVIEYMSIAGSATSNAVPLITIFPGLNGGAGPQFDFFLDQSATNANKYGWNGAVRLYGDLIWVSEAFAGATPAFYTARVSISGHLVPISP
jgi:hypothetical protein